MALELLANGSAVVLGLALAYVETNTVEDSGLVLLVMLLYGTEELALGRLLLVPPVESATDWLENE